MVDFDACVFLVFVLCRVLQSGVFAILSSVYVGEFNSGTFHAPKAKLIKH